MRDLIALLDGVIAAIPWEPLYIVSGLGAIALIVGAMAFDGIRAAAWIRRHNRWDGRPVGAPPVVMDRRDYLAGLVTVLALWIVSSWAR